MEKILQITAGTGPAECCWVVAQVLKYILKEASEKYIPYDILERNKGYENGTLHSAYIILKGENAEEFCKDWIGTIQWIGHSQYRNFHKRKNWFIGINEIKIDNSKYIFNLNDVTFQAIRSGGPGGQHVNKVSTAIRAIHHPTGKSVLVSDSRSQLQNKKMAIERLKELVKSEEVNNAKAISQECFLNHKELERGNPVKVFKGSNFKVAKKRKTFKNKRRLLKNQLRKELFLQK